MPTSRTTRGRPGGWPQETSSRGPGRPLQPRIPDQPDTGRQRPLEPRAAQRPRIGVRHGYDRYLAGEDVLRLAVERRLLVGVGGRGGPRDQRVVIGIAPFAR